MRDLTRLDRRIYVMSDVDRYLGLPSGTARRWIDGYRRGGRMYPPVIRESSTQEESVSWGEFVEAQLLSEFRDAGVTLQRLRPAVQRLRCEFDTPYPLATFKPLLDVAGRELVMSIQQSVDLPRPLSLVVVRSGQTVLSNGAQGFVDRADFGTPGTFVQRIRAVRNTEIVIDPEKAMGRPAVRAVPTEVLAEGFRAGESAAELASLYDLELRLVEQALRYEMIQSNATSA
jgi:uncharacterized protein (DUF433 family)